MKIMCETCGEVGTDNERWFYSMIRIEKMTSQVITKIEKQKCKKCGDSLSAEDGTYETMYDGSPYQKATVIDYLHMNRWLKKFGKDNKKEIKELRDARDND